VICGNEPPSNENFEEGDDEVPHIFNIDIRYTGVVRDYQHSYLFDAFVCFMIKRRHLV
jgi:hypothetical protein